MAVHTAARLPDTPGAGSGRNTEIQKFKKLKLMEKIFADKKVWKIKKIIKKARA